MYVSLQMDKFCYLGNMLSVYEDADAAVSLWRPEFELDRINSGTSMDLSLIMRGRLYSNCVQSSMLHGNATWPVRKENEVAFQQTELSMLR